MFRQSGWTGLMQAAYAGQTETVSLLLERGANVDTADEVCVGPLLAGKDHVGYHSLNAPGVGRPPKLGLVSQTRRVSQGEGAGTAKQQSEPVCV